MEARKNLLSPFDRKQCEQISGRTDIHGQRAKALLALNNGVSQAEAAEQTSLSPGQVRYAVTRFRKMGLDMFPEDVLTQTTIDEEQASVVSRAADVATPVEQVEDKEFEAEATVTPLPKKEKQPKKKTKKPKKDKKTKKDKAEKRKKKSGKGEKDKQSKKKRKKSKKDKAAKKAKKKSTKK